MKQEVAHEAAKAAPPVVVTSAHVIFGFTLNDWVLLSTLVYTGLLAGHLIWKFIKELRK